MWLEFQSPIRSVGVVLAQSHIPVTIALEWVRKESQGQFWIGLQTQNGRKLVALASSEAVILVVWVYIDRS